jgi:hypothetical protein
MSEITFEHLARRYYWSYYLCYMIHTDMSDEYFIMYLALRVSVSYILRGKCYR